MNNPAPTLPSPRIDYRPERIWEARQHYFNDGQLPDGLLDQPLLRSWERCRQSGRAPQEHVVFDPVERSHLSALLEREHRLLQAARPELDVLAGRVSEVGYAVLLTDTVGQVLAVAGALDRHCQPMRQAFRPGVDVSEAAIGTSAMAVALAEQRTVRVLGPEHYFANNQIFHCCAAPVFDPRGRLMGTVDVTRDAPQLATGVMGLTHQCAQQIEHRLFDALPVFLRIELADTQGAALAFDRDGVLLAANGAARHLFDMPVVREGRTFEDLFEGRFDAWASRARRQSAGRLPLQLHGGVRLQGVSLPQRAAARASVSQTLPVSARCTVLTEEVATPRPPELAVALRALEAGLPVLVTGETGAGKEVAARALHQASQRAQAPFLAINCGALTPELIASELFGHVEGAFTGAVRGGSIGKFEAARGGTVFLDEIGDMPLPLQVALLRVLDRGEVLPVGATQPRAVDVRVLCATHRNLQALVAEGRFREDLYYRISGFVLAVPPLRERDDFHAIVDNLCHRIGADASRLSDPLRVQLRQRPWPGNVRQLQHALTLAFAVAEPMRPLALDDFGQAPPAAAAPAPPWPSQPLDTRVGLSVHDAQRKAMSTALQQTRGNVTAAAAMLGIGRATLYRRLKSDPELAACGYSRG
ncbi:transcriptional regulator of acetoin/glycerol metabolism [Hydrogenophaga palleronii]|uniref:Transcriptional regulator of acetoin/glycerol metabolism n=1 Tax=Hydrogenophaga palleronii TaxID=65655 RepID=A0ABU1WK36_9BURK|nr:sigma-54-dependent Fis family transcriptional regulator [Hydrogenophaga palleronii]MDR7149386.1 transcriptional regulator of acetoin/glycerol metabolism [Hydrogenophaga palleronii]